MLKLLAMYVLLRNGCLELDFICSISDVKSINLFKSHLNNNVYIYALSCSGCQFYVWREINSKLNNRFQKKPVASSVALWSMKTETWHDSFAKTPQINNPLIPCRLRGKAGSAVTDRNRQGDDRWSEASRKCVCYGDAAADVVTTSEEGF